MRIVWLPRAQRELDHQIRYIAERNLLAAMDQDAIVAHTVAKLVEYPEIGRQGRQKRTRELVISGTPFLAVYEIHAKLAEVHIVRLLHAKQKWPPE